MDPNTLFCYWAGPQTDLQIGQLFLFLAYLKSSDCIQQEMPVNKSTNTAVSKNLFHKTKPTSEGGTFVWAKRDDNCTSWHVDSWHTPHRHSSDTWSTLLWAAGRCPDLPAHRNPYSSAQWTLRCLSGFPGHPEIHFLLLFLWNTWICGEEKNKNALLLKSLWHWHFLL